MIFGLPTTSSTFLSSMGHRVDCCPCPLLRYFRRRPALFVTFFNVFGLAFLFVAILAFVTAGHVFTYHRVGVNCVRENPTQSARRSQFSAKRWSAEMSR